MKLSKILLSTSLILPLTTLSTVVSCSNEEQEEGKVTFPEEHNWSVSNTSPLASITFNWSGKKDKQIQCSVENDGEKPISIVNKVVIDNDGNFVLKIRFLGYISQDSFSSHFKIIFKYDLNGKEITQKTHGLTLEYHYEPGPEPQIETPQQFIYNRTFSLMGIGEDTGAGEYSMCWGTAWILSDATKDNFADYQYYVATNWHVKCGIDSVQKDPSLSNFKICYGCSESALHPINDYTKFPEFKFISPESTFTYTGSKTKAIDFYVAKVNFGNNPSDAIKDHLDSVNSLQKLVGYTTKTAKTTQTIKFNDLTTYMGGYPVREEYYATWGFQTITENCLEFIDYDNPYLYHYVDNFKTIKDISPLYTMKDEYTVDPDWMPGGASGSMIIAEIDEELQVIGIYWGGFQDDEEPTVFWPAFSIFNSDYKDFSESY